jgi:predicted lipoprotein with Yx(FWY)xxD motif
MKLLPLLLIAALPVVAGCGSDDETAAPSERPAEEPVVQTTSTEKAEPAAKGTMVKVGDSDFGEMIFDAKDQAIYIFEREPNGEPVCYGECAEAWPPVFTDGEPVAGEGVKASLLGTVKRRDGKLQVTYADQPLYYYAHEGPGQVLCHNVNLNGGLWWVIGPDGKRRP